MTDELEHEDEGFQQVNITPLLDLALVLLVIFVISISESADAVKSLPILLPQSEYPAAANHVSTNNLRISITVGPDSWYLGNRNCSMGQLQDELNHLSASKRPASVDIRADRRIPYQRIISTLDLVRSSGIHNIYLETESFELNPQASSVPTKGASGG